MSDIYEIRLQGHLDGNWSDWLDNVTTDHCVDGTTLLVGAIADQAALHSLLNKIRDLGIPLILVKRVADLNLRS
jgi:hypothetical protein